MCCPNLTVFFLFFWVQKKTTTSHWRRWPAWHHHEFYCFLWRKFLTLLNAMLLLFPSKKDGRFYSVAAAANAVVVAVILFCFVWMTASSWCRTLITVQSDGHRVLWLDLNLDATIIKFLFESKDGIFPILLFRSVLFCFARKRVLNFEFIYKFLYKNRIPICISSLIEIRISVQFCIKINWSESRVLDDYIFTPVDDHFRFASANQTRKRYLFLYKYNIYNVFIA